MIRQRRPARTLRGAGASEARCSGKLRATGLSYAVTDRTRLAASQPAGAVRGRPRLETRVEESHRGERPAEKSAGTEVCPRAGLRSSRGSAHATDGRRLSAPTRDFGPTARLREGLLMMAMPHRREAT